MTISTMTKKCNSIIGHFDGQGSAPGQYRQHFLMQHVQGYIGSHWMPHWAATYSVLPWRLPWQQANKQQSTNTPTLLAVSMAMAMRRYVTTHITQWRRSRASLEATGRRHRASIMSDNIKGTWQSQFFSMFFIVKTIEKSRERC
jgi:hypothetical protein